MSEPTLNPSNIETVPCFVCGGEIQKMTWEFFLLYWDECYVPLSRDWCPAGHRSPEGVDWDTLQADLDIVTGS